MGKKDDQREETLRKLVKEESNRKCFDCKAKAPTYVCLDFHIFVCTNCSGLHREFGHRVKSISMAKFTDSEVKDLKVPGGCNAAAKRLWMATWDPKIYPETECITKKDKERVKEMMRLKFQVKKWYKPQSKQVPVTNTNTSSSFDMNVTPKSSNPSNFNFALPKANNSIQSAPVAQPVQTTIPNQKNELDDLFGMTSTNAPVMKKVQPRIQVAPDPFGLGNLQDFTSTSPVVNKPSNSNSSVGDTWSTAFSDVTNSNSTISASGDSGWDSWATSANAANTVNTANNVHDSTNNTGSNTSDLFDSWGQSSVQNQPISTQPNIEQNKTMMGDFNISNNQKVKERNVSMGDFDFMNKNKTETNGSIGDFDFMGGNQNETKTQMGDFDFMGGNQNETKTQMGDFDFMVGNQKPKETKAQMGDFNLFNTPSTEENKSQASVPSDMFGTSNIPATLNTGTNTQVGSDPWSPFGLASTTSTPSLETGMAGMTMNSDPSKSKAMSFADLDPFGGKSSGFNNDAFDPFSSSVSPSINSSTSSPGLSFNPFNNASTSQSQPNGKSPMEQNNNNFNPFL